ASCDRAISVEGGRIQRGIEACKGTCGGGCAVNIVSCPTPRCARVPSQSNAVLRSSSRASQRFHRRRVGGIAGKGDVSSRSAGDRRCERHLEWNATSCWDGYGECDPAYQELGAAHAQGGHDHGATGGAESARLILSCAHGDASKINVEGGPRYLPRT